MAQSFCSLKGNNHSSMSKSFKVSPKLSLFLKARTFSMGRAPCCSKVGLNRGPWTAREDTLLKKYIENYGEGNWRSLPKKAGLLRCGKSCRMRWMNYLRPNIKRRNMEPEKADLIIKLHALLGNRWSLIARRLPGRTDNEIKNYWNTHLSKVLRKKGIDPRTRRPLPPGALNTTPPRPASQATENKARTGKKEAIDGPPPIKVHVPKANRVDPFTFISKLRDNMVQLASLTRTQETGTSIKVSASSPSEAGSEMETKEAPAIEREVPAVPKSPVPAVADLSSAWPELEHWIDNEAGTIGLMDDHSGKGNFGASIFNSIVEGGQECYDNLSWLGPL